MNHTKKRQVANKWIFLIKEKPVLSIIIITIIASILGISIQFLIDGSFVREALFPTITILVFQIWRIRKKEK